MADASVTEGDRGYTILTFELVLSGSPDHDVLMKVSAVTPSGSTATRRRGPNRDFMGFSRYVSFPAKASGADLTHTVDVEISGDTVPEGDETFVLRVKSLTSDDSRVIFAGGGNKIEATGTIINDDLSTTTITTTTVAPTMPNTFKTIDISPYALSPGRPVGHACALRSNDTIKCWGHNHYGQTDSPSGTFKAVVAGGIHTCAIRDDDTLTCWGLNHAEHIDDTPTGTFKAVTVGGHHTCAIRTDDTLTCWGLSLHRQTRAPNGTFKTVAAGNVYTCAIRTDDTLTCWGYNSDGQTNVPDGNYQTVAGGRFRTCAIRTDQTLTCWGDEPDWQPRWPDVPE